MIDPGIEGGTFIGGKSGTEAVVDLVEGEGGGVFQDKGIDKTDKNGYNINEKRGEKKC